MKDTASSTALRMVLPLDNCSGIGFDQFLHVRRECSYRSWPITIHNINRKSPSIPCFFVQNIHIKSTFNARLYFFDGIHRTILDVVYYVLGYNSELNCRWSFEFKTRTHVCSFTNVTIFHMLCVHLRVALSCQLHGSEAL